MGQPTPKAVVLNFGADVPDRAAFDACVDSWLCSLSERVDPGSRIQVRILCHPPDAPFLVELAVRPAVLRRRR
jgi:hypothetical protein